MNKENLQKYAEVVIKKGVNLYKGQCLSITCGIPDYEFALILAECAYRNKAKYVDIAISSNALIRDRINNSENEDLNFMPDYKNAQYNEYIANDWAFIRIDNTGEFNILQNINSNKLEIIFKRERKVKKRYLEEASKHKLAWCVIASPNAKWAENIFKNENTDSASKKLDSVLEKILRIDKADPLSEWDKHSNKLIERAGLLNNFKFDKLIIKSEKYKTELEVGLLETSRWIGGPKKTPGGRSFIPNIPTEEVFTTPDFKRTSGKVFTTRPVVIMETTLFGIWFEFKNGEVINFGSDNNTDVLKKFIETDSGSSRLGEVALVDAESLIYKSGLIFNSILYDENASCHIALGNGYPSCLTNGQSLMTKDELLAAGCNVSLVHTDFMIGAPDSEVVGITASGEKKTIIKKGIFCI